MWPALLSLPPTAHKKVRCKTWCVVFSWPQGRALARSGALVRRIEAHPWADPAATHDESPFVEAAAADARRAWAVLCGGGGEGWVVPYRAREAVWSETVQAVMEALVEGFSRVGSAGPEARARMGSDLSAMQVKGSVGRAAAALVPTAPFPLSRPSPDSTLSSMFCSLSSTCTQVFLEAISWLEAPNFCGPEPGSSYGPYPCPPSLTGPRAQTPPLYFAPACDASSSPSTASTEHGQQGARPTSTPTSRWPRWHWC